MKKLVSIIVALGTLLGAMSVPVNAADYPVQYLTPGKVFDFETGYVAGDPKVELVTDTPTGNALKLNQGALISFYFGEASDRFKHAMTNGDYLISFDALMSHVNGSYMLRSYAWTRSGVNPDTWPAQEVFFTLAGGKTNLGIKQLSLGDGGFSANEWVHYDFLCHFYDGEVPTMDTYINYEHQSTVPLNQSIEKVEINGLGAILLQMQAQSGAYALLDNFVVKELNSDISCNMTLTDTNEFVVNVSESVPVLDKEDLSLTKTPLAGGPSENVDYDFINNIGTTIKIKPYNLDGGYTYKIKINKQTTFGKDIPEFEYDVNKSTDINAYWDFENNEPYFGTKVEHLPVFEENRGYALDLSTTTDMVPFRTEETLKNGRYIVSYDIKHDAGDKKVAQVRNVIGNTFGNYQIFNVTDGLKSNDNLNTQKFIGDKQQPLKANQWYRIDNVYDLDAKKSNVYVDGKLLGTVDLYGKQASKNAPIDTFDGIHIQWANGAGTVDNVRIKDLDGGYNASLKADGDKLYVDFEETTLNLSSDNFKVTKSDSFFGEGEEQDFELVYQNGARAVLQLDEEAEPGMYYSVEFNGVTSFLDSKLINNKIKTAAQGGDVAYIDNVTFVDVYNNKYSFGEVSSALKTIEISLPNGLLDDEINGVVSVLADGEDVDGELYYNADKKILVYEFAELLGSNKDCTVEISEIKDKDDKTYQTVSGNLTTGEAIQSINDFSLKTKSGEAEVTLFDVNTASDYEAYVIVTGYKDGYLEYTDVKLLSSEQNSTDNKKSFVFENDKISDCDTVISYIWNSWRDIMPVVQSASN